MKSNQSIVHLEDVSFSYGNNLILDRVNLTIQARDFIWIVGPNGGGKTTLIKIMLGLLRPQKGRITLFGGSVAESLQRVGYMPQHAHLDLRFPMTVADVALMGRLGGGLVPNPYSAHDRDCALRALNIVGLASLAQEPLKVLSGGQQRRLLIARALASEPDLLLLDEPTANLDLQMEAELHELLQKLNERLTVIMVSHDPAFVSDFVEHVVCVNRTVAVHPTTHVDSQLVGDRYGSHVRLVRHDLRNHRDAE